MERRVRRDADFGEATGHAPGGTGRRISEGNLSQVGPLMSKSSTQERVDGAELRVAIGGTAGV